MTLNKPATTPCSSHAEGIATRSRRGMSDESMTRNCGEGWPTEGIEQQAEETNNGVAVVHVAVVHA